MKGLYNKSQIQGKLKGIEKKVSKKGNNVRTLLKNDIDFNILIHEVLTKTDLLLDKGCYDENLVDQVINNLKRQNIDISENQITVANKIKDTLYTNKQWIENTGIKINFNNQEDLDKVMVMLDDQTLPNQGLEKIFFKLLTQLQIHVSKDWFNIILKKINNHPNITKGLLHEILELDLTTTKRTIRGDEIDLVQLKKIFINNCLISLTEIIDLKTTPYISLRLKALQSGHLKEEEILQLIKDYPREEKEWITFISKIDIKNKQKILGTIKDEYKENIDK